MPLRRGDAPTEDPSKTTRLIGRAYKCGDALSGPVLTGREAWPQNSRHGYPALSVGRISGKPAAMAEGTHPYPFRTRKLSPPAPMVLRGRPRGRAGRRRPPRPRQPKRRRIAMFPRSGASFAFRSRRLPPVPLRPDRRIRSRRPDADPRLDVPTRAFSAGSTARKGPSRLSGPVASGWTNASTERNRPRGNSGKTVEPFRRLIGQASSNGV
jgi:hypothetical protein